MLITSPALDKLMREFGSEEKINNFSKLDQPIIINLLENGKLIGYLRWVSLKFNLSLKFENLTYSKFLDQKTLKVDITKLIQVWEQNNQPYQVLLSTSSKN
ncbi:hypothetical protein H6F47_16415 [Sphaerospermopsis sp. FACHB-1094]|nr:hypothetical protein [Sphaerospermopsis sp. FACHB-1094]MBD2133971.1 hypothetical protein [Sphaerospermopsis sp. FACHB-1094]